MPDGAARRARALAHRMHASALIALVLGATALGTLFMAGPGRSGPAPHDLTRTDEVSLWGGLALAVWTVTALLCLVRARRPALIGAALTLALCLSLLAWAEAPLDAPLLPGLPSRLELTARLAGPAQAGAAQAGDTGRRTAADQAYLTAQIAALRGDAPALRHLLEPWRLRLERQLYGLPGAEACCPDWRPDVLADLETLAYGRPLSAAALDAGARAPDAAAPGPTFILCVALGLGAVGAARLWRTMRRHHTRIVGLLGRRRPRPD